jgi:hypothetical protein
MTSTVAPPHAPRRPSWAGDLAGVLWVLAAAGALMAPALAHGRALGPLDWLSLYGLSAHGGVVVHNRQTFDQVTQMIPWTSLGWEQVHHGHLPLWNPSSALGLPLAFNWQAASFSVPALAGYLAPLHLAYTVQVLVALALAGTGVYVLARVLGLGVLGCVMAATVYELSGPVVGWLGWPVAWVMAWAGWLFAATVLVLSGRRRARAVVLLAVVVACVVYAGQPDTMALLGLAVAVFVATVALLRATGAGDGAPVLRPLGDLVVAGVAGAALGAPLLLPGVQLTSASVRGAKGSSQVLPLSDLVHVIVQGFDGLPVAGSHWFGTSFYVRTAAYLGVVGVALAAVGVLAALRRRRARPELVGFGAVAVVTAAVVFVGPVVSLVDALPSVGPVTWNRSLLTMALALAVLAGAGTDLVVSSFGERAVRRVLMGALGTVGAVVLLVWAVGRGHLPPAEASIRARSLLWPAVATAGALVLVIGLGFAGGRRAPPRHRAPAPPPGPGVGRWVAAALVAVETVLLVAAGAPLPSSSPVALAPTPAEAALARVVGGSLVGFGTNACFTPGQLGVVPDVNVAFGLRELAVYDPLLPSAYYSAWLDATGTTGEPERLAAVPFSLFCPAVTSAAAARRFGVGFVLEARGAPGPPGTVRAATVGGEGLYRVPGAAAATVVPTASPTGPWPGVDAPGTAVAVSHPDPASWRVATAAAGPAALRLRLTDVPGWHATLDGRALALHPYAGVMLQARVPPGRHVVVLRYWPGAFSAGLALAGAAVVGLAALVTVAAVRRRRGAGRPRTADGPRMTGPPGTVRSPA